jgi:hypothetical protein
MRLSYNVLLVDIPFCTAVFSSIGLIFSFHSLLEFKYWFNGFVAHGNAPSLVT